MDNKEQFLGSIIGMGFPDFETKKGIRVWLRNMFILNDPGYRFSIKESDVPFDRMSMADYIDSIAKEGHRECFVSRSLPYPYDNLSDETRWEVFSVIMKGGKKDS